MTESQFSVTWDSYQKNICNGLSSLQQRGEFVDMTLAADGHHVKVHQMVLSLVSPYIKELIISAQCPHPVIFLNKISYTTLCAILEYAYTGEVQIAKEHLNELFEASRALQIKGLDEMHEIQTMEDAQKVTTIYESHSNKKEVESKPSISSKEWMHKEPTESNEKVSENDEHCADEAIDDRHDGSDEDNLDTDLVDIQQAQTIKDPAFNNTMLQYTVSTQGSPQLVLNRYIYYLRYTRKGTSRRQWRCVDYIRRRCPASLTTKNEKVLGRTCAHNHPFHDKKIMKKIRDGNIFAALQDVENHQKLRRERDNESQNKAVPIDPIYNERRDADESEMS